MVDPADGLRHSPPHIQSAGYLDRSSTVIPHGIGLEGFCAAEGSRCFQKKAHGDYREGPVVGCYWAHQSREGEQADFVEAMLTALRAVPGTVDPS